MVALHRGGRALRELSKEFGCSTWSIRGWVKRAERDAGTGDGGLITTEREELTRLRRENRKLREEREILSNVWSAPRLQGLFRRWATSTFRVNVSGLFTEPLSSWP